MSGKLHNANDALAFLEGRAIRSTEGTVIRVEDIQEARDMLREGDMVEAEAPRPKTMAQAKRMIREDEDLMSSFDTGQPSPPGRSVPAMDPNPLSRT